MNRRECLIIVGIVAAVAVALLVTLLYTMLGSHRPEITSLQAAPERILPRGTCQITCNATDADDDELTYGWSAHDGTISGEGATVTWNAPGSVGSYNVTVIVVDGRGSAVTDYVTITVRTNRAPTIGSLTADAEWTLPLGSLNVTCNAWDSDDDELSYEWSTNGGHITGVGHEVTWNAPQAVGLYDITVVVSDGHGSSDTKVLPISVAPEQPPIIEELLITTGSYGHCYLKPYAGGYYVGKEQMYDIECVVSGTSVGLSYEWSCTGGELSGDGSMVTWTAPNTQGKVTVTVIVSDIAGKMASKNLVLNVVSCSTCTFGPCSTG